MTRHPYGGRCFRQPNVAIVGAGLAGSECAFQLAERGVGVTLMEQKPVARSPAHRSDGFAELVCSNSFRALAVTNAVGLLKEEMRRAGSLIIGAADRCRVPAGGALAVDRERFSRGITQRIRSHPCIRVQASIVERIPDGRPVVLATGPLTAGALAEDLERVLEAKQLAYYDAISPIVRADSIDWQRVFRASRYGKGEDAAYVNCPLNEVQYHAFVNRVRAADKVQPHGFESVRYFEGCLPLETMAERGPLTLCYGPLKPVGLVDPRTGRRPFAVLQLRQEDADATEWSLVGCQTRMTRGEQRRVFSMVPGLESAVFERFGSVHRNTFVNAPLALDDGLQLRGAAGVYLAGQVTGVEGYVESAATGFCLGIMLASKLNGQPEAGRPPPVTALGALLRHLERATSSYQPSNVVWSMFPPLDVRDGVKPPRGRAQRRQVLVERARSALDRWLEGVQAKPMSRTAPASAESRLGPL